MIPAIQESYNLVEATGTIRDSYARSLARHVAELLRLGKAPDDMARLLARKFTEAEETHDQACTESMK